MGTHMGSGLSFRVSAIGDISSRSTFALLACCCHEAIRRGERARARECAACASTLASAAQAHGVRRGGVATSRRPSGYLRSVCSALLCVCALPGLAGIQWDKAMPFEGRAEGGWPLTVTGSFTAAATYQCQFAPMETSGVSFIASDPVAPSAGATCIVCTTPRWSLAAQRTRLSVLDAATSTPVAGPGGSAEIITYVADSLAHVDEQRARVSTGSDGATSFGKVASVLVCIPTLARRGGQNFLPQVMAAVQNERKNGMKIEIMLMHEHTGTVPPGADFYVPRPEPKVSAPCEFLLWRRRLTADFMYLMRQAMQMSSSDADYIMWLEDDALLEAGWSAAVLEGRAASTCMTALHKCNCHSCDGSERYNGVGMIASLFHRRQLEVLLQQMSTMHPSPFSGVAALDTLVYELCKSSPDRGPAVFRVPSVAVHLGDIVVTSTKPVQIMQVNITWPAPGGVVSRPHPGRKPLICLFTITGFVYDAEYSWTINLSTSNDQVVHKRESCKVASPQRVELCSDAHVESFHFEIQSLQMIMPLGAHDELVIRIDVFEEESQDATLVATASRVVTIVDRSHVGPYQEHPDDIAVTTLFSVPIYTAGETAGFSAVIHGLAHGVRYGLALEVLNGSDYMHITVSLLEVLDESADVDAQESYSRGLSLALPGLPAGEYKIRLSVFDLFQIWIQDFDQGLKHRSMGTLAAGDLTQERLVSTRLQNHHVQEEPSTRSASKEHGSTVGLEEHSAESEQGLQTTEHEGQVRQFEHEGPVRQSKSHVEIGGGVSHGEHEGKVRQSGEMPQYENEEWVVQSERWKGWGWTSLYESLRTCARRQRYSDAGEDAVLHAGNADPIFDFPVYVLNLPWRQDRRRHAASLLLRLGFSNFSFPAVTIKDMMDVGHLQTLGLVKEDFIQTLVNESNISHEASAKAYLAHTLDFLAIVGSARADGFEKFVIFEDDINTVEWSLPTVQARLHSVLEALPPTADLLHLEMCYESCALLRYGSSDKIARAARPGCSGAILVTLKGASRLEQLCKPIWHGIDVMLPKLIEKGLLESYVATPPIFFQDGYFGSDAGRKKNIRTQEQVFATRKHTPVTTWCWEAENFFADQLIGSVVMIQPTSLTNHLYTARVVKVLGSDFERALAEFGRQQQENGAFNADLVTNLVHIERFQAHFIWIRPDSIPVEMDWIEHLPRGGRASGEAKVLVFYTLFEGHPPEATLSLDGLKKYSTVEVGSSRDFAHGVLLEVPQSSVCWNALECDTVVQLHTASGSDCFRDESGACKAVTYRLLIHVFE
jgi:predicted anti-sigma-YlaC factor YlaD